MAGEKQAWEAVLAAVEADMQRSAEFVAADSGTAPPGPVLLGSVGPMSLGAPAPELPPLAQMPPVPEELGERIRTLRAHIIELQVELAGQIDEWRARHAELRRPTKTVSSTAQRAAAHFVDRRL